MLYAHRTIAPLANQLIVIRLVGHAQRLPQLGTFLVVAGLAGCDSIFPCDFATAGTWDHVIDSEIMWLKRVVAVLALIQVAQIQVGTAETHIALGVEILLGYGHCWIVDREVATASNVLLV